MIREFTQTPLFGILLSLIAFEIGVFLNRKTKISLVQPILIALIFILIFLSITGISYENYKIGGDYISLFLSPVTVTPTLKKTSLANSYRNISRELNLFTFHFVLR